MYSVWPLCFLPNLPCIVNVDLVKSLCTFQVSSLGKKYLHSQDKQTRIDTNIEVNNSSGWIPSLCYLCGATSLHIYIYIYIHAQLRSVNCPISCNRNTCKLQFQHLTKSFHYLNYMQSGFFFSFLPHRVPSIFVRTCRKLQLFPLLCRIGTTYFGKIEIICMTKLFILLL